MCRARAAPPRDADGSCESPGSSCGPSARSGSPRTSRRTAGWASSWPPPPPARSSPSAARWCFLRWPWAFAFATLACVPIRIPVELGDEEANLLLPLYAVVAAFAVALGWQLLRGDDRARELGPIALPLAALVGWGGLSLLWSDDLREGSIFILAFVLPFGLLAIGFARLPWARRPLIWLYGGLIITAAAFAYVGLYQWATRDVFWNPTVIVGNAYAPFYRVNSVFWDPSIYGRYLVVAILATLALVLLGLRGRDLALGIILIATLWVGLLFSFSQSSFAALIAGVLAAATVVWRWRAAAALGLAAVLLITVGFATPQVRNELLEESRAGLNNATSGRASLVGNGIRIARDNPITGVGVGSFKRAYADRTGLRGREPRKAASHSTPVTVAAETGLLGLLLLGWLGGRGARSHAPRHPPRRCRPRGARGGAYAWRHRRAQPFLQRALRGSDHVGPARSRGADDRPSA